jgi:hypothetical protein
MHGCRACAAQHSPVAVYATGGWCMAASHVSHDLHSTARQARRIVPSIPAEETPVVADMNPPKMSWALVLQQLVSG